MPYYKIISEKDLQNTYINGNIVLQPCDIKYICIIDETQIKSHATKYYPNTTYIVMELDLTKLPDRWLLKKENNNLCLYWPYNKIKTGLPIDMIIKGDTMRNDYNLFVGC